MKSCLLRSKLTKSGYLKQSQIHYEESKQMLLRITQFPSLKTKIQLLKTLLESFNSSFTLGYLNLAQDMHKNIVFSMLQDTEFRSKLLLNCITSEGELKSLGYELLLNYYKRAYNHRLETDFQVSDFLPYILKDQHVNTKARFLLEELRSLDSRVLIYSVFTALFSRSEAQRVNAFSALFREDIFDKCLRIVGKNDGSSNDRRLYQRFQESLPKVPFEDPLQGIYSQKKEKVVYFGKLNVFEATKKEVERIPQQQVKELFDLLNIAVNQGLANGVRKSALEQINEVFFFYRNSIALREFAATALSLCLENIASYGEKREALNLDITGMSETQRARREVERIDLSEENIQKIAGSSDGYNKYAKDYELVVRFTAIMNNILANYGHLEDLKTATFGDFFRNSAKSRLQFRTFWELIKDPNLERRHQGLLALNLIFLNGYRMRSNVALEYKNLLKRGLFVDQNLTKDFVFLHQIDVVNLRTEDEALSKLNEIDHAEYQIESFISHYLETWRVLSSASKQSQAQRLRYGVSVIDEVKRKRLEDAFRAEMEDLTSKTIKNDAAGNYLRLLTKWSQFATLSMSSANSDYFFKDDFYTIFRKILTDSLVNYPDTACFETCVELLCNLVASKSFKSLYPTSGLLRTFLANLAKFFAETLISYTNEISLAHIAERIRVIEAIMGLLTKITETAFSNKEEKLIAFIRQKIFKKAFIARIFAVLRVIDSHQAFTDLTIQFLLNTVEMMINHPLQQEFIQVLSFVFDSLLILKESDNFAGSSRLLNLLKLAHSLVTRNKVLSSARLAKSLKSIKMAESEPRLRNLLEQKSVVCGVLKSTTVGWIVRLTGSRLTRLRMLAWNVLVNYVDEATLEMFPSLVDSGVALVGRVTEAVGVHCFGFSLLTKVAILLRKFGSVGGYHQEAPPLFTKKSFINLILDRGKPRNSQKRAKKRKKFRKISKKFGKI